MSGVAIDVPVPATGSVRSAAPGFRALFDALFGAPATVDGDRASWQLNEGQLTIRATAEAALSLRTGEPQASPLRIACSCDAAAAVVPGLGSLEPTSPTLLQSFLLAQLAALDHIGINFAADAISETHWRAFVASVDREWPVHVLDLPGGDVVAIALAPRAGSDSGAAGVQALEIVYDRRAQQSSWHVCARVKTDKAATERAFPAPRGACKPGDEPYFRSVTAAGIGVPFYLDLAYADGAFPRWSEIVAAMGHRWG